MADNDDRASIGFIENFLKQPVKPVPADNSNMFQQASVRAATQKIEFTDAIRQEIQTQTNTNLGSDQSFFSIFQPTIQK